MSAYQPPKLAQLGRWLATASDEATRRRLVLEFLRAWQDEPRLARRQLLADEPDPVGDPRYDVLLAALAEHLAAADAAAPPDWAETRALDQFWFPDNTPAARADALVRAPAAFRRRGVFLAAEDLARA